MKWILDLHVKSKVRRGLFLHHACPKSLKLSKKLLFIVMYTYVYGSVTLKEKDLLLEKQESGVQLNAFPFPGKTRNIYWCFSEKVT